MQQTNRVTILATQLATTDRRALSQAWYSALHLVEHERGTASANGAERATRPEPVVPRGDCASEQGRVARREAAAMLQHGARRQRLSAAPIVERRAPKSELARRIERVIVQRRRAAASTSFAIAPGGGRVHLLVRNDGGRTRVVALCAPALRERVERALAHARYALAAQATTAEIA
jgi:hypothetical protein